jgi:hypothetical protein
MSKGFPNPSSTLTKGQLIQRSCEDLGLLVGDRRLRSSHPAVWGPAIVKYAPLIQEDALLLGQAGARTYANAFSRMASALTDLEEALAIGDRKARRHAGVQFVGAIYYFAGTNLCEK